MVGGKGTNFPIVLVRSAMTLGPGGWLNDEVIFYFLTSLKRMMDTQNVAIFNPFFLTKLMEQKEKGGEKYNYANVKNWSNAILKDTEPLKYEKLVFIYNQSEYHWSTIVLFPHLKHVESFDSLCINPQHTEAVMFAVLRWFQDEQETKWTKKIVFSDFKLFSGRSLATQENGWDCGVYSILIAHCVAFGRDIRSLTPLFIKKARSLLLTDLIKNVNTNFDLKFDPTEMKNTDATEHSEADDKKGSTSDKKDTVKGKSETTRSASTSYSNVARRVSQSNAQSDDDDDEDDDDDDKKKSSKLSSHQVNDFLDNDKSEDEDDDLTDDGDKKMPAIDSPLTRSQTKPKKVTQAISKSKSKRKLPSKGRKNTKRL
jgi:hypothetical protein